MGIEPKFTFKTNFQFADIYSFIIFMDYFMPDHKSNLDSPPNPFYPW